VNNYFNTYGTTLMHDCRLRRGSNKVSWVQYCAR